MRILTEFESTLKLLCEYGDSLKVKNTLEYIFALSHQCYVLLSKDDKKELCKIEFNKTSPLLKPYITQKLSRKIKGNTRNNLLKTLKQGQWRIMQCVLKPFKKSEGNPLFEKFLTSLKIPNGVYIFTLTDAQLLRSDGTLPWHMITNSPNPYKGPFLPIFATSGQEGYEDITIPNEDDLTFAMNPINYKGVSWDEKKSIAVFRAGKATGCGLTPQTNMRLKLSLMKSPLLDVGIIDTKLKNMKFDPIEGLGYLDTSLKKVNQIPMFNGQDQYKYIIHVDGNVLAYRLLTSMLTGSLILRVKSPYIHWLDDKLQSGKHYISISDNLENLDEKIDWCLKNDSKCKKIAENGRKFAEKYLDLNVMKKFMETNFKLFK